MNTDGTTFGKSPAAEPPLYPVPKCRTLGGFAKGGFGLRTYEYPRYNFLQIPRGKSPLVSGAEVGARFIQVGQKVVSFRGVRFQKLKNFLRLRRFQTKLTSFLETKHSCWTENLTPQNT